MAYIGWATHVNKIILDSTSITVGEGAVVRDTLEGGGQAKSRLTCANPPDKYSVQMSFDCVHKGFDHDGNYVGDNLTELERFWIWYKWVHCYGANPFQFPAILINSNRQNGYSSEDRFYMAEQINNRQHRTGTDRLTADDIPDYEYYQITSAAEASKQGNEQLINMTWETYATGVLSVVEESPTFDHIEAENGVVDMVFTDTPTTEPAVNNITLKINDVTKTISKSMFDNDKTFYLFYTPITVAGTYTVSVTYGGVTKTKSFVVA